MPLLSVALAAALTTAPAPAEQSQWAKGVVFEDRNKNGRRDAGERGISNVRVSQGITFANTDADGNWRLPFTGDDVVFYVIKPRGWMTPVDEKMLPQFYYVHAPNGHRGDLRFKGVGPTGPLPESIDFPLHRQSEPNEFKVYLFGDTQPRDLREVDYIARDVVEPLKGNPDGVAFGTTMGDIVFDDLSVMEPLAHVIAMIGVPWYNVLGNHDINFDTLNDHESTSTWKRIYGPPYYSFDHGPVHFVVLDNVWWPGQGNGSYSGGLGSTQMAWLREDLRAVPEDKLVVLMMHIPMMSMTVKEELFEIIKTRPHCFSISAHTHYQEHNFLGSEEGYTGSEPHHHMIAVTACGSWWTGAPDVRGVPETTMRDGAPNGYSIMTFTGNQYNIEFRAAHHPAQYQMELHLPDQAAPGEEVELLANVFGGSERSTVEVKVGSGEWTKMTHTAVQDPDYVIAYERSRSLEAPYRPLSAPMNSPHIWQASLRLPRGAGLVPVMVRTTDQFGNTYTATRGIRLVPAN